MKQTEGYGLNQWEMSDLIRMEDFNADNARVDAALAGLRARIDAAGEAAKPGGIEILSADTLGGGFSYTDEPKTEDWNEWDVYGVYMYLDTSACGGSDAVTITVEDTRVSSHRREVELPPGSVLVLLFPWHNENNPARGLVIGKGTEVLRGNFPFKDINRFAAAMRSSQNHEFQGGEFIHFGIR